MPLEQEIVFITPGVFSDGGGFVIWVDGQGRVHVTKVPPSDPEVRAEIAAAIEVLNAATSMRDQALAQRFAQFAQTILQARVTELRGIAGEVASVAA